MKLRSLILALIGGMAFAAPPATAQDLPVSELLKAVDYQLVSKKRVSRTEFEYEYSFSVENNTNQDLEGVFATVSTNSDKVVLTDNSADVGNINGFSQKPAQDTIKVRVDRRARFSATNDLIANFDNDTVEGIDTNQNGVRDSVEVYVLTEFDLSEAERTYFFNAAEFLQNVVEQYANAEMPTSQEIRENEIAKFCFKQADRLKAQEILMITRILTIDSDLRKQADDQYRNRLSEIGLVQVPPPSELMQACQS
ncbi:MAG: hypothetical protein AAGA09_03220 [Pseudomonadota bacterium]